MAAQAGTYVLPPDGKELFDLYYKLYTITAGAVTPLVGKLLVDAGYDADYSLETKELHRTQAWEDVLVYAYPNLVLKEPALLDVGAAGKGYLVDIVSQIIMESGVAGYCVDAGGDMRYAHPTDVLQVGLEHPDDASQVIGIVQLAGGAICGSAGNRRRWGKFTHIIDPFTQSSPQHLKAVWVTAELALVADGLTTALFFVEPTVLQKEFSFEYALVRSDDTVTRSSGFPAEIF